MKRPSKLDNVYEDRKVVPVKVGSVEGKTAVGTAAIDPKIQNKEWVDSR